MSDDLTERGLEFFGEVMGQAAKSQMREAIAAGGHTGDFAKLATDFAFGSVWTRQGLDRKQRSLVLIGILIAQRQPAELKNHVRIALANGLTAQELGEALIQATPYVGFPAATTANTAIIEVLRELGLDEKSRTPQERGMI
jgi:4-carboxymuconolactone decarboxylase